MLAKREITLEQRMKTASRAVLLLALLTSSPSIAESRSDNARILFETLQNADALTQPQIVRDIEALGENAVPPLIDAMNSGDKVRRHQAIEILGRIGKNANGAIPPLIDALKDPEAQIRRNAAWALARVGEDAGEAMPALLEVAEDVRWDVRSDAVWAMGKVVEHHGEWGSVDGDLVAAAIDFLNDHSHHVRWSAAWSLARFGPGAEGALQALVDALEDEYAKVRASAASALGRIAASHHEDLVGEALTKALDDESALVRTRAAAALQSLRTRTVPSM